MSIIELTSIIHPGKKYSVKLEVRGSGTKKNVFFSPDNSYVVAIYKKAPDPVSMDRLKDLVQKYYNDLFNMEGGDVWKKHFCWPYDIVQSPKGKYGIVMPLYPPDFIFQTGDKKGIEKKGNWFTKPSIRKTIDPSERGNWRNMLFCAYNLARTIRRLHAAGLCHSDLSFNNVLLNPSKGKVQVIDVDELVVPGKYPAGVLGTQGFIAPEVIVNSNVLPSQQTDLHALACLIYQYLFCRDPLLGRKIHNEDAAVDDFLSYGEKALFIEDRRDPSNKPKPEGYTPVDWSDVDKVPYTIAGPYLIPLFQKAFEEGLHNPSARPSASQWENALWNTYERIVRCANPNCSEKFFVLNKVKRCPFCGQTISQPLPVFDLFHRNNKNEWVFYNKQVYGGENKSLHKWHFFDNIYYSEKIQKKDVPSVAGLQWYNGAWYFKNIGLSNLTVTDNRSTKQLKPDEAIALKEGMILENGEANGMQLKAKFI